MLPDTVKPQVTARQSGLEKNGKSQGLQYHTILYSQKNLKTLKLPSPYRPVAIDIITLPVVARGSGRIYINT